MKSLSVRQHLGGAFSALVTVAAIPAAHAVVTVDGTRDVSEGYALLANQSTVSNWNVGGHEALANIHAIQDGNDLAIHLAARVQGRGIILFVDSKAGGRNFISNNLITFGGEENYINSLGADGSSGMTFESGFEADYAIRVYGDGATGAFVNIYNLAAGTRTEAGNAGVADISKGIISLMRAFNLGAGSVNSADYAAAVDGVEMKLNLAALGVLPGAQTVKLMAILVDTNSTYGSNQVLASRTSTTDDIAGAINSINFQTETGTQTLSVGVTGPDSRNVVFNVDMTEQIANGFFTPGTDRVKVLFFSGGASPTPGEIFLTDDNADDIHTGTLVTPGADGDAFGEYKYFNTRGGAPNSGFEYGSNRNFNLGPLNITQTRNETFTGNSFALWSAVYSDGQSATQDRDNDGMKNAVEYFMGTNNSEFTPNPKAVGDLITWPRDPFATGVSFKIWTSENLSDWDDATDSADVSDPASVKFNIPTATPKLFVRFAAEVP